VLITSGANNGAKTDQRYTKKTPNRPKPCAQKTQKLLLGHRSAKESHSKDPEYEKELLQGPRNAKESHSKDPGVRKRVIPRTPECERESLQGPRSAKESYSKDPGVRADTKPQAG
jgi:hypothetical protein